ncbi:SagB/ThcOx family dehydrogenase [Nostocoides sp. F2B08]|uniref:SagB/ThcOx family dehydrogenase n=1 Tax=Nostocoides sp. F2B08 TaxID=2653936 RepID=UPI00186B1169|nr:SagB/ThcOx family dehydrogenase [Tetrasphaera sp. F2B08]
MTDPATGAREPLAGCEAPVRRAGALVARFEDGGLVLENYLTGRQAVVHHQLIPALAALTDPVPAHEAVALLGGPPAEPLLDELVRQDLLLRCGTPEEQRDASVEESWVWGPEAQWFHYRTRRTAFTYDLDAERDNLLAHAATTPPPPPFTDLGPPHLPLPAPLELTAELGATLRRRRTERRFSGQPLSLDLLATILHTTWGVTQRREDPGVGPVIFKTSPSGGARHPVEVYLVALNIDGLKPGAYHYCSGRHTLTPTGEAGSRDSLISRVLDAVTQQPWAAQAAAVFVMTGVTTRSAWKYQQSHAYRVLLLDAGHLAQTFHLACTALDLAPWTTAALDEDAAEQLLGITDPSELVLYAAACGHHAANSTTQGPFQSRQG